MKFIGELAALATSFFFAMTALIFTSTSRLVGSQVTNRLRLSFALVGPVLGVSASLLAVQHAEIGVASTLMACTKSHTLFS